MEPCRRYNRGCKLIMWPSHLTMNIFLPMLRVLKRCHFGRGLLQSLLMRTTVLMRMVDTGATGYLEKMVKTAFVRIDQRCFTHLLHQMVQRFCLFEKMAAKAAGPLGPAASRL